MLAASSATQQELEAAKERTNDGSRPVAVPQRPYRPKLDSLYVEPALLPDELDGLELLHQDLGHVILKHKTPLPPREDVIV